MKRSGQITLRIILWSLTLVKLLGAQSNGILSPVFFCCLNFWCHAWTMCCTICHYQEVLESKNSVKEVSHSCFCDSWSHQGRKKMSTKLYGLVCKQTAESPFVKIQVKMHHAYMQRVGSCNFVVLQKFLHDILDFLGRLRSWNIVVLQRILHDILDFLGFVQYGDVRWRLFLNLCWLVTLFSEWILNTRNWWLKGKLVDCLLVDNYEWWLECWRLKWRTITLKFDSHFRGVKHG